MMRMKKISWMMIVVLLFTFITTQVYAEKIPFTDVPENAWYYNDVKTAYESNLINGKTPTQYAPNDNMTAAEAVKLAAAMHKLKNEGKVDFASSAPWYKVYVDYAKEKNIITDDFDWNKKITRAGYMNIFAQILTDEESKKNDIPDGSIPDVPMTHPSAQAIYKLYRAGVVRGVDDKYNCNPGSDIKRSEVAAILTRMMDASHRLAFSIGGGQPIGTKNNDIPLTITKHPANVAGKVGDLVRLEVAVAGGKAPLKYEWQYANPAEPDFRNSKEKGNATNILEPPVESTVSYYRCVIADADGKTVISDTAKVNIIAAPIKITKQPKDVKGKVGEVMKLEVMAEGGKAPLNYQWQYSNPAEPDFRNSKEKGNTTNILEPPVESTVSYYRCVITDADGKTVTSDTAKVDLIATPLAIKKHPKDAKGKIGDFVRLEVLTEGGKTPLKYQWEYAEYDYGIFRYTEFRNSKAKGNTTNVLEPAVEKKIYGYRCIVTDADGKTSVTSNIASVSENVDFEVYMPPIKITKQPKDVMGKLGDVVRLEVVAEGGKAPLKYQWKYINQGMSSFTNSIAKGNTTNVLEPPVENETCYYRCEITDADGKTSVTSQAAMVGRELMITKQPKSAKGSLGDIVRLEVIAEGGKAPLKYEWQYANPDEPNFRRSIEKGNTTNVLEPPVENGLSYYRCVITDADGKTIISEIVMVFRIF